MSISLVLSVAVGGACGAVGRFLISHAVAQRLTVVYPWGTFVANVAGCLVLGALYEATTIATVSPEARAMLSVGFLGALTTFSTFVLESINLVREGEWGLMLANVGLSLVAGFAACILGIWAVRFAGRILTG